MEEILIEENYVSVRADSAVPCIIVELRGFANRTEFKRLMTTGLAYYQAHNRPTQRWGWVADTRQMSAIPQDVQQWLATDWNVQAFTAGLREMSIVTAANVQGQLATQQYVQQAAARTHQYELEPVYYASVAEAKVGAARRCADLNVPA